MEIAFGPPGHKGVTQIMGLSGTADPLTTNPLKTAGGVAAGAWLLGMILGSSTVKNMSIGALVAVVGVKALKENKTTIQTIPSSIQGY